VNLRRPSAEAPLGMARVVSGLDDDGLDPATSLAAGRRRFAGVLFAATAVLGFSIRPILVKHAYSYTADPVTLIALRMAFALPFFVLPLVWRPRRGNGVAEAARTFRQPPLAARNLAAIALLGCLGYYAASFLDFVGLQYVSAGVGRLLLFLYPTVVVILSALFLGKRVERREIAALAVSYAGVALVLSSAFGANVDLPRGAALVFAGAVLYAVYLVGGSRLVWRAGSVRFTCYAMIAASVCCILQFLLLRPLSALDLPPAVFAIAAVIAVVCTVIPVFLTAEALRRIGANEVAIIGALGPASVVLLGYLGFDEPMTLPQLGGTALVLAGVLLVSLRRPLR
jgi:drug/metabolite transporter (DMT)-like permease